MKLTGSSLGAFRDCPRKYHYLYGLGRVALRESVALSFGSACHGALAYYWSTKEPFLDTWLKENAADMPGDQSAKLGAMLANYRPPISEYEVLGVEQEFENKIINPETNRPMIGYTFGGKIDGLIKRKSDGKVMILEHKTTADEIIGFGTYWQRLQIDNQISFYVLAFKAAGCMYDVLRKPGLKPSKADEKAALENGTDQITEYGKRVSKAIAESPEEHYQFRDVVKTEDDIEEARYDLYQQAQMLAYCVKKQRWPRNSGACRSFYGVCPYLEVCTGRARIEDDALFRTKERKNEELA